LAELGATLKKRGVRQTTIKTRQQAQQLLDQYVLPEAQVKQAEQIQRSFNGLFPEK
jgi:hypothetical protein